MHSVQYLFNHSDPTGVSGFPLFFPKQPKSLLTLIITTSVIPIHPETRLISEVLESYLRHEKELIACRKIIVCDFPKLSVSGTRQFKSGKILEQDFSGYEEYICKLEKFCEENEYPFINCKILRCTRYRGFAMAVYEALKVVETPYIMIIQHDRVLSKPFGIELVLDILISQNSKVKYIGLSTGNSEGQIPQISSRYKLDLTPYVIIIDNDDDDDDEFLKRWLSNEEKAQDVIKKRRILVPLIFWYDSTHIACTKHYRTFVFGEHNLNGVVSYAKKFKLGTGDFIEDKLGQGEREDIKANGIEAHEKYGNYLLEDGLGPFVQHCHGRLIGTSESRSIEIYFGDN